MDLPLDHSSLDSVLPEQHEQKSVVLSSPLITEITDSLYLWISQSLDLELYLWIS